MRPCVLCLCVCVCVCVCVCLCVCVCVCVCLCVCVYVLCDWEREGVASLAHPSLIHGGYSGRPFSPGINPHGVVMSEVIFLQLQVSL
jgi:hypothetical protein